MKKYFSILIILSSFIYSQNQDSLKTELSPVVITATKTETALNQLASSVSVITSNQIQEMKDNNVSEVLRNIGGISLTEQGGPGKLTSVFMRGMNSNQTLVLIDGVEVNDPSNPGNSCDFSNLQLNNVDRIEIVRGAQSTLYGSDAMGGVINIITKKGTAKPSVSIQGEMGSDAFYKWNGSLLGSAGIFNYSANYSLQQADGFSAIDKEYGNSEKDGFKSRSFSSRLGVYFTRDFNASLIYKFNSNQADLDQAEKQGDDPNFTSDNEDQIFRGELNKSFADGLLNLKLGGSIFRKTGNVINKTDASHPSASSDNHTDASRSKIDFLASLNLTSNKVIFGLERELEKANSRYESNSVWGPYVSEFPEAKNTNMAVYLQDQFNFENLFFTAGIRNDQHQKFGSKFTYRIAPAYLLTLTNTKLKFTYGTGFKAPSLYQLFDPLSGNADLKPEESKSWDAGIEQFLLNNRISVGTTYFHNDIDNLIGYDAVTWQSLNINKAKTTGIEVELALNNFYNFAVISNYTYIKTEDLGNVEADYGKHLLRRPDQNFNLNINYKLFEIANLNLNYQLTGKRDDKDFSVYPGERITLPAYSLVDFAASVELFGKFNLYGKVKNIFDKKYQEVFLYGTPGRTFYTGIELNLR